MLNIKVQIHRMKIKLFQYCIRFIDIRIAMGSRLYQSNDDKHSEQNLEVSLSQLSLLHSCHNIQL